MKVSLSKPDIGQEEIDAVVKVLQTDQLSLGPVTKEFEQLFAKKMQAKFAIAINSGTSGLHVAVRAAKIGEGDEVITSPFSFIASSNCILFEKAKPIFVDIEEETYGLDPELVSDKISDQTKGILPVHVFGQACQIRAIQSIADRYKLHVIEDACESILATHQGDMIGSFGDCAVFGFYPNKQMTTGEGGMIITNNEELYEQYQSLRNQGRATDMRWLSHYQLGYNYRISEMTAAIGLEQTKKLPEIVKTRQQKAELYRHYLKDITEIRLPSAAQGNNHTWFVYAIRVAAQHRDLILAELNKSGIQSKAYFFPCIHLQDFYKEQFGFREGMYPVAEKISREVLVLPFHNKISEEQIQYVASTLKKILTDIHHGRT